MLRTLFLVMFLALGVITPATFAQVKNYKPVTDQMLLNLGACFCKISCFQ